RRAGRRAQAGQPCEFGREIHLVDVRRVSSHILSVTLRSGWKTRTFARQGRQSRWHTRATPMALTEQAAAKLRLAKRGLAQSNQYSCGPAGPSQDDEDRVSRDPELSKLDRVLARLPRRDDVRGRRECDEQDVIALGDRSRGWKGANNNIRRLRGSGATN